MNNLNISTNPTHLNVETLNTSSSLSPFLGEEDTSTCPLLPTTPSPPPPHNFNDPLTPNVRSDECIQPNASAKNAAQAAAEETSSSCSGSSEAGIDGQVVAGTTSVFKENVYQYLGKNGEVISESEAKLHAHLKLPDSKDVPSFVYWNWKLIRQCSFFVFASCVVAMVAVVVTMIYTLPKTCNPKTVWYEGSVFLEIHPSRFPDSNVDGFGDLRGLAHRTDFITKLGAIGVRLNSIFPSKHQSERFQNVTTLFAIDEILGSTDDLKELVQTFHRNNLSLILDLPVYPYLTQLEPAAELIAESNTQSSDGTLRIARASEDKNTVVQAISLWMKYGIDGFYIKGLENLHQDPLLVENIRAWKSILGPNRILMINNQLLENVADRAVAESIVKHVDLVDIFINVTNSTKEIAQQINRSLNGVLRPDSGAFIQWSIGGVADHSHAYGLTTNGTLAATLMSLMLPGSPNVCYGYDTNEHFSEPIDSKHMHHLSAMAWNTVPQINENDYTQSTQASNKSMFLDKNDIDAISRMITLRDLSPSIYKNMVHKKSKNETNTSAMYHSNGNILILMRWYPRRHTFVAISNFGDAPITLDLSNSFYSGEIMIGERVHEQVLFNNIEIGPIQTIVVKLDK